MRSWACDWCSTDLTWWSSANIELLLPTADCATACHSLFLERVCAPGFGLLSGVCTACTAGKFSPGGANVTCQSCPNNRTSRNAATFCDSQTFTHLPAAQHYVFCLQRVATPDACNCVQFCCHPSLGIATCGHGRRGCLYLTTLPCCWLAAVAARSLFPGLCGCKLRCLPCWLFWPWWPCQQLQLHAAQSGNGGGLHDRGHSLHIEHVLQWCVCLTHFGAADMPLCLLTCASSMFSAAFMALMA